MKCLQMTHNLVTLNRLIITLTWSAHFKIVSKISGYGWKRTNSNWIVAKQKPFVSHPPLLSTLPYSIHMQSLSAILKLSSLELSATVASSSIAIFQWNSTSSKHVKLHTLKSDAYALFTNILSHGRRSQNTSLLVLPVQIRLLQFPAGRLSTVTKPLQQVQNSVAKLIFLSRRAEHAKPFLKQLHWLPIEQRIEYKTSCLCYQIITGTAPQYLADLVQIYVLSRSLRSSSDDRTFRIPHLQKTTARRSGLLFLCCTNLKFSPFCSPS